MIRSRVSEDGVLYLADGVEFISPREFYKRGDIRKIYFPSSIVEIGKEAFAHCENLEEIIFQNGSSCNFVYGMAFSMCKKLRGIDLPFSLTGIGFGGFFGCKSLKAIKGKRNLSHCQGGGLPGPVSGGAEAGVEPASGRWEPLSGQQRPGLGEPLPERGMGLSGGGGKGGVSDGICGGAVRLYPLFRG